MAESSPAPKRGIQRKALDIVLPLIVSHALYSSTRNDNSWENEDWQIKQYS
jgi:hypothetical protein